MGGAYGGAFTGGIERPAPATGPLAAFSGGPGPNFPAPLTPAARAAGGEGADATADGATPVQATAPLSSAGPAETLPTAGPGVGRSVSAEQPEPEP